MEYSVEGSIAEIDHVFHNKLCWVGSGVFKMGKFKTGDKSRNWTFLELETLCQVLADPTSNFLKTSEEKACPRFFEYSGVNVRSRWSTWFLTI